MLRSTLVPLLILAVAAPLQAQAGRADLRYTAGAPLRLTYTMVEQSWLDADAAQAPPSTEYRSLLDVELSPAGDGVDARIITRERTSSTGRARIPEPLQLRFSPAGQLLTEGTPFGRDEPAMGEGVMMLLPGRELGMGEGWEHNVTLSGADGPLTMTADIRIRVTYERDTLVAGRLLNVIHYTSEDVVTGRGDMLGNTVEIRTSSSRKELVLWDSARHLVVHRDSRRTTENESPQLRVGKLTSHMIWTLVEE
jgi:hypothetical protein